MAVVEEALLQLAAVHARHPEIEDQAFGPLQLLRSKKGLRRREGGHPETSRPQGESRWVDVIVAVAVGPLFALLGAGMLMGAWMAWRRYRG